MHHYIEVLRAKKWTILVIALLVLAIALVVSYRQTPLYQAQARILVEPLPSAPTQDAPLEPVIVTTESQLVASQPVAALVKKDLNTPQSASTLLKRLTVAGGGATAAAPVPLGSQVLVVTYTSPSPRLARDAANAFASDYIDYRGRQAASQVATARTAAERSIQSASREISKLTKEINIAAQQADNALVSALETQRNALYSRLGVLQQRLDDLQPASAARSGGAILINSADLPDSPSSPDYFFNCVLALFVGLGLGTTVALLRERLDKRFRGRADVEQTLGAPVLATIPAFGHRKKRTRDFQVVTLTQPKGPSSEAYRSLRTNLQYITIQRGMKSLLITSAAAGEGKTVTTVNLAIALAHSGQRVIVVSADLRRPTLEKYFGLERGEGLSTWLVSNEGQDLWKLIQDPDIPNIRVLTSGPIPSNPAELLNSSRVGELLDLLSPNADLVLFDSAPVLGLADAPILASRVDGTLLIVDAGTSHKSAGERAREEIERAGGAVIGCLLNAYDPSASPYYYYESPYYYYAAYGGEAEVTSSNGGTKDHQTPMPRRSKSRFSLRR
ncbi:MAG: polysaccharide biosynthesis tyrosine autokinase [Actinomycetota bacterium]|nr:polysaccharide biosynthesis tyrosine autokinase [Actinomycetota bacterium]